MMGAPVNIFQRKRVAPARSPSTDMPEVAAFSEPSLSAAEATASPPLSLLDRLTPEQRGSILRVSDRLLPHFCDIVFDLHGP